MIQKEWIIKPLVKLHQKSTEASHIFIIHHDQLKQTPLNIFSNLINYTVVERQKEKTREYAINEIIISFPNM